MSLADFAKLARASLPVVDQPGLQWALAQPGLVQRSGTWVEFGVHEGGTLREIAKERGEAKLWGFDSFQGLPEDWNDQHPKGTFRQVRPTMPPDGVNIVAGWFADTLGAWLPTAKITFVHMDCDLYSSARTCMTHLSEAGLLAVGAIMVWDDFFTEPHANGVMRALYEERDKGFEVEWLANPRASDVAVVKVVRP